MKVFVLIVWFVVHAGGPYESYTAVYENRYICETAAAEFEAAHDWWWVCQEQFNV